MEWTFLNAEQFPEKANWYKRVEPDDIEKDVNYLGATQIRYRQITNDKGSIQPIKGLRVRDKSTSLVIETSGDPGYGIGDIIEFYNDETFRFTIKEIREKIDSRNKGSYLNSTTEWPGFRHEEKIIQIVVW